MKSFPRPKDTRVGAKVMRKLITLLAILTLFAIVSESARTQDAYPSRPVKIMIAFPVGGLLDTVSRVVGEKLSVLLGQQFIVEARPGAGGTLATAAVAKSDADGYTLMMINDNHALNPSVFKNIPYDSVKDFAPIGFVGYTPLVLIAYGALPMHSVKDLVEAAKQKPGTLTYGSVGVGSASHLAGVMLEEAGRMKWQHVPYRGGAPALNDLLAGHINTMFMSPVVSSPARAKRQAYGAGARRAETDRGLARRADHGGGRIPGRSLLLVRPGCTRRHAAGGAGQA